jgi:hypothetical protein
MHRSSLLSLLASEAHLDDGLAWLACLSITPAAAAAAPAAVPPVQVLVWSGPPDDAVCAWLLAGPWSQ